MKFKSTVPGAGKKVIIEARVNEYMSREVNPNVPFTPDEIAEAADCTLRCAAIDRIDHADRLIGA